MFNTIKTYMSLLNLLVVDFLNDLRSFRVQLIYMSYIFNAFVLYAVIYHGLNWKALTISFGTQTMIYAFYFASKAKQAEMENRASVGEEDPNVE